MIAHVSFSKEVEKDNWHEGVTGHRTTVFHEKFTVEFENTEHFKEKLADLVTGMFDVPHSDFIEHVSNECDNDRFDYNQNEDDYGNRISLTEENPDGYLAHYEFFVLRVTQEISYTF